MSRWAHVVGAGLPSAPASREENLPSAPHAQAKAPADDTWWERVVARLRNEGLSDEDWQRWIAPLQCVLAGDRAWLAAPNRFVCDFVERELLERIRVQVIDVLGRTVQVSLCVGGAEEIGQRAPARAERQPGRAPQRPIGPAAQGGWEELPDVERAQGVTVVRMVPRGEYPTALTRLPIFLPGWAQNQPLDTDNALRFCTPWGSGRRHGPPLTVYDEDTLIALLRLRQRALSGPPESMPCQVTSENGSSAGPGVSVHVVQCRVSDIQRMCGASTGGMNNKRRLDSVKRLTATRIEFDPLVRDRLRVVTPGGTVGLLDVRWKPYEENALLYVQFPPAMTAWLEDSYTRIDWAVRCKLRTDVAKAVHRFLSGQPKGSQIGTKKLQAVIDYRGAHKAFLYRLRGALEQLVEIGWLTSWSIVGTGRATPVKAIIKR